MDKKQNDPRSDISVCLNEIIGIRSKIDSDLINEYDKPLRKFLLNRFNFNIIANTDENIFDDASVKTVVFVLDKKYNFSSKINFFKIVKSEFSDILKIFCP